MDSRIIADLVLHLGRMASGDGLVEGLTPAQWTVLRYIARSNRFSRTPSAFAASASRLQQFRFGEQTSGVFSDRVDRIIHF